MNYQQEFEEFIKSRFPSLKLAKYTNTKLDCVGEYSGGTTLTVQQVYEIFLYAYGLGVGQERVALQAQRLRPPTEWEGCITFLQKPELTAYGLLASNRSATNAIAGDTDKRGVR